MLNIARPRSSDSCGARSLMAVWALAALAGSASAEVPARTHVGQTLLVADAEFDRGQIFYLHPGQDTQVAVTSVAALQRTILTSSRAVGYVVGTFDPEDSEQPILGGALRLPVASLASGSPATDETLKGEDYLHIAEHPEVTFELTETKDVERLPSDDDDVFPFRMKLLGRLTVRGATREIEMPAEVSFLLTNFDTFARTAGDLVRIHGSFELSPADFDWEMPPGAAGLVAAKLNVDVFLVGSTLSPEKNLDPEVDQEQWLAEQRYLTLARDLSDSEAAAEHGEQFLAKYRDDAEALDALARTILDSPGLPNRDLALARQLVERAGELAGDAAISETRSRLAATRGDGSTAREN